MSRALGRGPALAIGLSAAFYAVFAARAGFRLDGGWRTTLFDDAMISLTYARTLAGGDGLVWFPGAERVEGYTNFVWTLVMSAVHLLPIPDAHTPLAVVVIGAVALVALLVVVHAVAGHVLPPGPGPTVAVLLTGLYYPLAFWTLRGMEVGLVALLLMGAVLLALRLRARGRALDLVLLAAVVALGVLTRTDVAAPMLLVAAFAAWTAPPGRRGRVIATLMLAIFGTLAAHTAFRIGYYGEALPNTYHLKVAGIALSDRLARGSAGVAYTTAVHLWAAVALAAAFLAGRSRQRDPAVLLLVGIVGGQIAYSAYVGGDAWEFLHYANRYIAVGAPALMVLAAGGVADLAADARRRIAWPLAAGSAGIGLLLAVGWFAPAALLQLRDRTPEGLMIAAPLVLALLLLAAPFLARRVPPAVTAGVLAGVVLVGVSGEPLREWVRDNAAYVAADARMVRYGLHLRDATSAETTIAVVWAGAIPYVAERPVVDLLGKNDPVVARTEPVARFHPGHDKWDYGYSVGVLRPAVVAQLYRPTAEEIEAILAAGYMEVAARAFVREDAEGVDADAIRAFHEAGLYDEWEPR